MAWPPNSSQGSQFYQLAGSGFGAIQWGTDGMYSTYIVKSIRSVDNIETVYVEQGSGLRAIRIQLWQGREYELTFEAPITYTDNPLPGTAISLIDPMTGATVALGKVTQNHYNAARKQPGERVITITWDFLVDGGSLPAAH